VQLSGVLTALVTPFSGGSLDIARFQTLVERQLAAGIEGLVPCGTTGETPTLEPEEWTAVVRASVTLAKKNVPVIAGCGSNSTAKTVAQIEEAKRLGADGALVVLPYYNKPNAAGHRAHLDACVRTGLPIVPYHVPGRTAQLLPVELLAELCNRPGVAGVKEATGDVTYGLRLLGLSNTPFLSGDDFTFAPLVCMGAAGVISVLSNVAPGLTVRWCAAARNGDVGELRRLNTKLFPVVQALFAETNPIGLKAMMAQMGLLANELRLPLAPSERTFDAALLAGLE
jgi:4-hydroxy-tetrahydrodipicolinate synthase